MHRAGVCCATLTGGNRYDDQMIVTVASLADDSEYMRRELHQLLDIICRCPTWNSLNPDDACHVRGEF